jgi:hypothetical protein
VPTQSWRGKSAVFHMYSALTSNGYRKSIKAVRWQRNLGLGWKALKALIIEKNYNLTFRKWCYTPLQHDFALDPIIPPFVTFSEGKRQIKPRYDNVTLSPLLLPARVTNRSHSTYGSSARSDSHRAVFCPNSIDITFNSRPNRNSNNRQIKVLSTNTDIYKNSYFPKTIKDWNNLIFRWI